MAERKKAAGTAYEKKIDELKIQAKQANDELAQATEARDNTRAEVKRLEIQKETLQNQLADLNNQLSRLEDLISSKQTEGDAKVKVAADRLSNLTLSVDSVEFHLKQLEGTIEDRRAKLRELDTVPERHANATAELEKIGEQIEDAKKNLKAVLDAVAETDIKVKARDEESKELARATAADREELKKQQEAIEFYRNRLVAYCTEKGLPIPTFDVNG